MGFPADVSNLDTFGCLMYAISTKRHDAKLTTENIIRGKLLGYGGSMKTFILYNLQTRYRGRATHARFDEAQLSAPQDTLSSNSRALWGALQRFTGTDAPDTEEILTPPEKFRIFAKTSPFLKVRTMVLHIKCNFDDFGLFLETDPMSHQNIVVDVAPFSSALHLEWTTQLQFHTVIQIDDTPIFTVHEVQTKLYLLANALPESIKLIVAPYKSDAMNHQSTLPQVAIDQLQVIHHILH
jgi:hypothetical protein